MFSIIVLLFSLFAKYNSLWNALADPMSARFWKFLGMNLFCDNDRVNVLHIISLLSYVYHLVIVT